MATDNERAWRDAADRIAEADFLLVAAGAGFSARVLIHAIVFFLQSPADSGLPVYNDIADVVTYEKLGMDYQDLCDPNLLDDDNELFYGFWGHCFNSYRDTLSHRGYKILEAWKHRLSTKRSAALFNSTLQTLQVDDASLTVTRDPFFIYTSNVDGHFHRHFDRQEVYELHGSVEQWQCAGTQRGRAPRRPCGALWTAPRDCRFDVDPLTMQAHDGGSSCAVCSECNGQGRPNVLMFHDTTWAANTADEQRYVLWEAAIEQMLQDDPTLRLVVLEIGCGTRVPSVRTECEMVVADVFARCDNRPQATLVRINPDAAECEHPVLNANNLVVSVRTTGLEALDAIEQLLQAKKQKRVE